MPELGREVDVEEAVREHQEHDPRAHGMGMARSQPPAPEAVAERPERCGRRGREQAHRPPGALGQDERMGHREEGEQHREPGRGRLQAALRDRIERRADLTLVDLGLCWASALIARCHGGCDPAGHSTGARTSSPRFSAGGQRT